MNRNQKIAIGCGGAGCLGLLVVAVVALGLYFFWYERQSPTTNRNVNISINSNRSSNTNSSNSNSSDSTVETPSSSMSDDDKHKLFQAASGTQDAELILRVQRKIGFSVTAGSDYEAFVTDHVTWALNNTDFIVSVSTPDKARAYVDEHLDD